MPPVPSNTATTAHVPDSSSLQDTVALTETIQLPVQDADRYDVAIANTILGSGFSSRLFRDLRVRTGYVYSVSSSLDWTRTRSGYTASFGADPDKVVKARALLIQDIKDVQTHAVSDIELNRAKAQMLRALPMQRASVDAVAGLYLR